MKPYYKLSYKEKFKRTIYAGIPILLLSTINIFYFAPTIKQKVIVPLILLLIWIVQLIYTYKKPKEDKLI